MFTNIQKLFSERQNPHSSSCKKWGYIILHANTHLSLQKLKSQGDEGWLETCLARRSCLQQVEEIEINQKGFPDCVQSGL